MVVVVVDFVHSGHVVAPAPVKKAIGLHACSGRPTTFLACFHHGPFFFFFFFFFCYSQKIIIRLPKNIEIKINK